MKTTYPLGVCHFRVRLRELKIIKYGEEMSNIDKDIYKEYKALMNEYLDTCLIYVEYKVLELYKMHTNITKEIFIQLENKMTEYRLKIFEFGIENNINVNKLLLPINTKVEYIELKNKSFKNYNNVYSQLKYRSRKNRRI